MTGSVKGLFKRKMQGIGKGNPGKTFDLEKKAWERRGEKLDMTPEMPAQAEDPVMPMADEEEIKRSKRRTASARGGGRASTIFTDSDRLGP
jgi:hypothetical protein